MAFGKHHRARTILTKLERSILCSGGLPERPRLTLDEWWSLPPEATQQYWDRGISAVQRVRDHRSR
jgi:hypothetical protein